MQAANKLWEGMNYCVDMLAFISYHKAHVLTLSLFLSDFPFSLQVDVTL